MNNDIKDKLEELQEYIIRTGKAPVFFIGSGMGRRYLGLPDWDGLLQEISKNVSFDFSLIKNLNNEEKATELEYHCFSKEKPNYEEKETRKTPLRKKIIEIIGNYTKDMNQKEEMDILGKTNPAAIITTNYDTMLEDLFGKEYKACVGQKILMNEKASNHKMIYKIHGCVSEPDSIVITKEDYDDFFVKSKYLYAKLLTFFWEYPIVFMGYSISDRNVKHILASAIEVMTDEQIEEFKKRVWLVERAENEEEAVGTREIELPNNKSMKVIFFELKKYHPLFIKIKEATTKLQSKNLKFSISENAIDLLIRPLYQQQKKLEVVVRELLQNAIDACKVAKKRISVTIDIQQEGEEKYLVVSDEGIGMNWEDINDFFLVIGKSSKKDSIDGLVGRFGIGILSVFLIGENAIIYTKRENAEGIGLEVYNEGGEKRVKQITFVRTRDCGTTLKIRITDIDIKKELEKGNNEDRIKKIIGLDKYFVTNDADIKIQGKKIEMIDMEEFHKISEGLYIQSRYQEKGQKNHQLSHGTALINDMVMDVKYKIETNRMIQSHQIPFVVIKTDGNRNSENIEPELSRKGVMISGDIVNQVVNKLYDDEIKHMLDVLAAEMKRSNVSLLNLRDAILQNCVYLKECDIICSAQKLIFSREGVCCNVVYGDEGIYSKLVRHGGSNVLHRYKLNDKATIGDFLVRDKVKGISKNYLQKYIYDATGSYNGFRIDVLRAIMNRLGEQEPKGDNATQIWSDILNRKDAIREKWNQKAKNGIVWFDNELSNIISSNGNSEEYSDCIIVETKSCGIDSTFLVKLESKMAQAPEVQKYIDIQ